MVEQPNKSLAQWPGCVVTQEGFQPWIGADMTAQYGHIAFTRRLSFGRWDTRPPDLTEVALAECIFYRLIGGQPVASA